MACMGVGVQNRTMKVPLSRQKYFILPEDGVLFYGTVSAISWLALHLDDLYNMKSNQITIILFH